MSGIKDVIGFVERVYRTQIYGWAKDNGNLDSSIEVDLLFKGRLLSTVMANRPRADLKTALSANANYGFLFDDFDAEILDISEIEVRSAETKQAFTILETASALEGYIEKIHLDELSGWAWHVGQPGQAARIDVFHKGVLLCVAQADEWRQDLDAKGIGAHAFHFSLRSFVQEGDFDQAQVSVHFHGSNIALADIRPVSGQHFAAPVDTPAPEPLQRADVVASFRAERGELIGWIRRRNIIEAEKITVYVDGDQVWEGLARRRVQLDGRQCDCGFRIALPEPELRAEHRKIEIFDAKGDHVPGSPTIIPYGDNYIGSLEVVDVTETGVRLCGWCINTAKPSEKVLLLVKLGARVLFEGLTQSRREDLSSTGLDAPFAAFEFVFEFDDVSLNLAEIDLYPALSTKRLSKAISRVVASRPVAALVESRRFPAAEEEIEGTVDQITDRFIRGWARDKQDSGKLVVLDCFIDGEIYATSMAKRFRADLKKHFGDHGFHEYIFELTPALHFQKPGNFKIVPRVGTSLIKHKFEALVSSRPRSKEINPKNMDWMASFKFQVNSTEVGEPKLAFIVINRNGAQLLESFFASFVQHVRYNDYEIIVMDHASTDDSEAVTLRWGRQLIVRWIQRGGNFSFSDSNNVGAINSDADLVIFVNNDVTFTEDVVPKLLTYMSDPKIGCLGIRLQDDSPLTRSDSRTAIQHLGVHFQSSYRGYMVEAFESRYASIWKSAKEMLVEVPCVTGAFMVCRRHEFLDLGGFNTRYFYGYEDIDLCLTYQQAGKMVACANDLEALHLRGFSRDKMDEKSNHTRTRNREVLDERFGFWMRRHLAEERFSRPAFWTSSVPKIAFVVTEATETTLAGDYFTALELAAQLSAQFPCQCTFVEVVSGAQYELAGVDVVIAMRDDFDPRKIKSAPSHIITVAWVRNWFERFSEREAARYFDAVWASSPSAAATIAPVVGKAVLLLPIATNWYRFTSGAKKPEYTFDYCFTGSYWGLNREIIQQLDPAGLPFSFAIFGVGWEKVPHLAPYTQGSVPYKKMPDIYASTRVVIDDANHVTKAWGGVNSRVFDALAQGALVITNGVKGSQETFDGELPTFNSPQELEDLLWTYLTDEKARLAKVKSLREKVKKHHTYQLRAKTVWQSLNALSQRQYRIAIKIGAPNWNVKDEWGDYHYALSMKYYLDQQGHTTRIDTLDTWDSPKAIGDDVVIVLRGLTPYKVKSHQINLMWNISHPDKISLAEYSDYDHVFVASSKLARKLGGDLGESKVSCLLQCTDARYFNPDVPELRIAPKVLFIGNSRNTFRRIVKDAASANLPLEVYGSRWEGFLPDDLVKGQYIDNREIASYYKSAAVLLNDHWDSMAAAGLLSNRLFDAAACGARIISDYVEGLEDVFGEAVQTYREADELPQKAQDLLADPMTNQERRAELAGHILREHTFERRVSEILIKIAEIAAAKLASQTAQDLN